MEALETAAKSHNPSDGGSIIPYACPLQQHQRSNFPRIGPCDVTSKEDLQKLYDDLSKKEKHLDLLSEHLPS